MKRRQVLAGIGGIGAVGLAGCTGILGGPEIVARECGNAFGAGGCEVTIENPTDDDMTVEIRIEALSSSDDVVATNVEQADIPAGERRDIVVTASNVGGDVDRYEVEVEEV